MHGKAMRLPLLLSGMLSFFWVVTLGGAPDPDLFDGRIAATGTDASGIRNEDNKENEASEIDMSGDVSNGSSTETAGEVRGGAAVSGESEHRSSPAKAPRSATDSGRSFEEFEIGVVGETDSKVEVNRSKEFSSQSASVSSSQTTDSDAQNSKQDASESNPGDQQSYRGSGEADYGSDVPSGL